MSYGMPYVINMLLAAHLGCSSILSVSLPSIIWTLN